jgi:hypothetical protein
VFRGLCLGFAARFDVTLDAVINSIDVMQAVLCHGVRVARFT